VHAAEAYRGGVVAELGNGSGEAFRMQTCGITQGTVLVDTLAPVCHDQGARVGHYSASEFDQVEQRSGLDALFGLQLACAQQVPSGVEHGGGNQDRSSA
jgi:hypothetical protein